MKAKSKSDVGSDGRLEFERVLQAPPETVWRFLVESDLRGKWLCLGEVDSFEGGKIQFRFDPESFGQDRPPEFSPEELTADFEGTVLIYSPPKKLAFTWPEAAGGVTTKVTITLSAADEGTLLRLVHEELHQTDDQVSAAAGWHAHLEQLECHLSRQLSPNFWKRHQELDVEYRAKLESMQATSYPSVAKGESKPWKPGRGKMGFMKPLLGKWLAVDPDTPMGKVVCIRSYEPVLDGEYIQLKVDWDIGDGKKTYQEIAYYGLTKEKVPTFWSFTSDGGNSTGTFADVESMHPGAKGFEAEMPAGLARFGFWPTETGMIWAAEAKTKTGWMPMIHHECVRIS